ncbi:preprotein translocase subunit YajC [Sphingomonas panacisoli]|uniref:Sec translocon accessory complex subunit YajC n=1 Tax=Sphingomonas panacisoli TaxID=1813879 RepID=A0A5B8LED7_9SPHN|nr:preprotein translocase subunit YajC [Sphingomonas panacisoli]QDZ06433.1 preprotein translocase subunit YajC [Sphingomonas panacisoli]
MFIPSAYAQTAGAAGSSADPFGGSMLFFGQILLIGVVFYFLMIRPQQRRAKELRTAIDSLKKNDQVITTGGILGKVVKAGDVYVEVEVAPNVKVQVVKGAISEVISPTTAKPAND